LTEDGLPTLAAGGFSTWLAAMLRALGGAAGSEVPCGGCTACCTSSQFVHVGPDETETLARIPPELLFPAPRLPSGNMVLGYDADGHCPMLIDNRCSIYEHRPRTCRTYDCRVFAATGVEIDGDEQVAIAERVRRWRFDFPTDDDRRDHVAVLAAARFVRRRKAALPEGVGPANATQQAVLAIEMHEAFIGRHDMTDGDAVVDDDHELIRAVLRTRSGT
jgi:Fe-S-cluster containining protein